MKNPYKLIDRFQMKTDGSNFQVETINYIFSIYIYRLIPLSIFLTFETYSLFLKNFYYKLYSYLLTIHPSTRNIFIPNAIISTQRVDTTRLIHNSRNSILNTTQLTLQIRSSPPSPVHDERNRAK